MYTLYLGYTVGAYNFNDFPFTRYSRSGFNSALSQMKDPPAETNIRMVLFGTGAVVMSLLTFLKYRPYRLSSRFFNRKNKCKNQ